MSAVTGATADKYLATAMAIGGRLVDAAVWDGDRCTWLGDDLEPVAGGWDVVHRSCGRDLYGGTSGIALFLGFLAGACREDALRRVAEGAIRHALLAPDDTMTGMYDGAAGVAWAAIQLGELVGSAPLAAGGMSLAERVADTLTGVPENRGIDLIAGTAGAITALLGVAAAPERAGLIDVCRKLGEHLLSSATRSSFGWSWKSAGMGATSAPGLCGLAHGASGVALALRELCSATGADHFRSAADEAVRYERSWFDRRHGNWPDLRGLLRGEESSRARSEAVTYPVSWCHGAVGIGLTRFRAYQLTGNQALLAEAGAAIQAARAAVGLLHSHPICPPVPFEANMSLCHGLAGTAELFLFAYEVTGHPEHLHAARRIGDQGIALAEINGGWPCGVPGGGEVPGLMLGLAGIGACYLRLYNPSAMPPIGLLGGWSHATSIRAAAGVGPIARPQAGR